MNPSTVTSFAAFTAMPFCIVSPARALFTAFWMVVKSQRRERLQTVCVVCGPFGLDWTGAGFCGAGYDWALAPAGASSAAVASAASSATRVEMRMTFSFVRRSRFDDVPAGHPRVLMREDVAVVEPATRVVLDESGRDALVRAHRRVVGERARRILPAVPVDVEGVEVVVHAERVDLHVLAHARGQRRRVPGIGAPVDAVEVRLQAGDRRRQLMDEQRVHAVRRLGALRGHDDGAE